MDTCQAVCENLQPPFLLVMLQQLRLKVQDSKTRGFHPQDNKQGTGQTLKPFRQQLCTDIIKFCFHKIDGGQENYG